MKDTGGHGGMTDTLYAERGEENITYRYTGEGNITGMERARYSEGWI